MASVRDSTQNTTASGNSVTVTTPTGTTTGDYLLAFIQTDATGVTLVDDSTDFGAAKQQNGTWGASTALFGMLLSGAPDASYTFSYTGGADQMLAALVTVQPGGGEVYDSFASTINVDATGTATGITSTSITVPAAPSVLLMGFGNDANRTVVTPPADMTVTETVDGSASELIVYYEIDDTPGATTKSIDWNLAEQMSAIAAVVGFADAGPTIDTQPQAGTAVVNETTLASLAFVIVATTSGGTLLYDWELETSVGGGVYANIANGSGATWTGQAAATVTGIFTAATLSGRRVRCNVTDDNGTVTSTAVTLTVYTGPVLVQPGVTNGSGVATTTYTTDFPVSTFAGQNGGSANGWVQVVTAVVGGVTKRFASQPTPP